MHSFACGALCSRYLKTMLTVMRTTKRPISRLLIAVSCGHLFGPFVALLTLNTVVQSIYTSKRYVTVKLMVSRSSTTVRSYPDAWTVVLASIMFSSEKRMNGRHGMTSLTRRILTSSPKILKLMKLLSLPWTRSDTLIFRSTASMKIFQLLWLVQLELVNQFTFRTHCLIPFPVKSISSLRSVSQLRLVAIRFKILLMANLTRLEVVFLDPVWV